MTAENQIVEQARRAEDTEQPSSAPARFIRRIFGTIPTLVVLGAIVGVAYWGHQAGWKAPSLFASGKDPAAKQEDWCDEHNVPESRCIKCNPALVGANMKDWCPEHGVPESKCTLCHPEILKTGVAGDWCPEHGLPESSCTLCHPEIAVKANAPVADSNVKVTLDPAATRPVASTAPTTQAGKHEGHDHAAKADGHDHHAHGAQAGDSHIHKKDPKTCQTHALRVQFASPQAVRKAGVKVGPVVERQMAATLSANAEVNYNRNRYAQIASPVAGRVWRVEKEVGQNVKQGEVVALVEAAEVGKAKADLLEAMAELDLKSKTVKRLRASAESGFRTDAELQEAEAAVKLANIRLFNAQQALMNLGLLFKPEEIGAQPDRQSIQFLGLPSSLAQPLGKSTTANLLPLLAPFDGAVIEQSIVAGAVIEPSKPLLAVADTSQMWVTADVPVTDAGRIAIGQSVTFRPDGAADRGVTSTISWISTEVDDQTRTVKVRTVVENPQRRLLAHTFGKAEITIREKPTAIAVPTEAIQWEGCCHIVFIRLTEDIFQVRKVRLGSEVNGYTEVLNGVLAGEVVVTAGSHVLKSEILKSGLGAGCADGH